MVSSVSELSSNIEDENFTGTKKELLAKAQSRGIGIPKSATKAQIIEALGEISEQN